MKVFKKPELFILKAHPIHTNYFASSLGEVYSSYPKDKLLRKLSLAKTGKGLWYYKFVIYIKGLSKNVMVHKFVYECFHGSIVKGLTISHIDGNRFNNKPCNLVMESQKQNNARKAEHGTLGIGVYNSRSKIDLPTLIQIRQLLAEGNTHKCIGDKFQLGRAFISHIANGSRYKDQGLI